jgi:hypothetical protein
VKRCGGSDLYRGVKHTSLLAILALVSACTVDDLGSTAQESGAHIDQNGWHVRWPGVRPIYYYIDVDGHHADILQPGCNIRTLDGLDPTTNSDGTGDVDSVQTIEAAIDYYESETPLRFQRLTHAPTWNDHLPVMIFTSGDKDTPYGYGTAGATHQGAFAQDDYQGCIFLPWDVGDWGYSDKKRIATVQHEIGHVIGLIHEQNRSDRDGYVDVLPDPDDDPDSCVTSHEDYDNLKKYDVSTNLTPYDYHSIMHYPTNYFCDAERDECDANPTCNDDGDLSDCICATLLKAGCTNHVTGALDPNCTEVDGDPIGSLSAFSPHDINALYRMYEPSVGIDEYNDQFGTSMVAADFDGDGYDDLAVGTPNEGIGGDAEGGAVQLFKGTEGGLVQWKYLYQGDFGITPVVNDRFGAALAAGDYDSDGDAELFVGAPGYNSGRGAVFRYNGRHDDNKRIGLAADTVYTDPSPSAGPNNFGTSVAVGKVDGTTMAFVVGAPTAARYSVRSGMAFVHTYNTSATTWTTVSPDDGTGIVYASGIKFGQSLAIGNLTSTTSGGLVVGAPAGPTGTNAGRVFVFSGSLAPTIVKTANNPAANDQFGFALDVGHYTLTTAGRDYLSVGAPQSGTGGKVTVWEVSSTAMTLQTTLTESDVGMTANTGDRFGAALAHGKLMSTVVDSLVVGIPGNNANKGAIAMFHHLTASPVLSGWTMRYEQDDGFPRAAGDGLGTSVAIGRFGDVTGDLTQVNDAIADVAAGAPGRDPNGVASAGSFQWWFGRVGDEPTFAAGFDEAIATPE